MKEFLLHFLLMLLIFAASMGVRFRHLSRPLSGVDDTPAVQTLITLEIWGQEGADIAKFNPKTTFPNLGDKYVKNFGMIADKDGHSYNPNYPQLGYILPYVIFKTFHIPFTIARLKDFNLVLHFLCALLVYLCIVFAIKGNASTIQYAGITGIIGFTLYTFFPQTLWYQSSGYFPEMLSQFLIIAQLTVLMNMISSQRGNFFHLLLLSIITIASVYTDWIGMFICVGVCLYAIIYLSHSPSGRIWFLTMLCGILAFVGLVYQFSFINNLRTFLDILPQVFHQKAGLVNATYPILLEDKASWLKILSHYFKGFPFILGMIIISLVLLIVNKKLKYTFTTYERPIALLFWGLLLPVIAYQIVFFKTTTFHEFTLLKMVYFFVILAAIFLHPLLENFSTNSPLNWVNVVATMAFVGVFVALGIQIYEYQYAYQFHAPNPYQALGEAIKKAAKPEEVVFVQAASWKEVPTALSMYAERNIEPFISDQDARFLLETNGAQTGIIFQVDSIKNNTLIKRYINK